MPAVYSTEDVLCLAPDPASAKAGQGLAHARHWVSIGRDDAALWGECQGSGKNPYQTQVDLSETAFKCSCPSRKFPCKHGLGLLLLHAAEAVTSADQPNWVREWLSGRQSRAEKKATAANDPKPIDKEAQAERRGQRLDRMRDGLLNLHRWVLDWARNGTAAAPGKRLDAFDAVARRLIDAQVPGIARRVRELGSIAVRGAGWQRPFLELLAMLHLLCKASERYEKLPTNDQFDLLAAFGVPVPQAEIAALPTLNDVWCVAGQTVEIEERLRTQRTWLFGRTTKRSALVLQFAHGTAPLDTSLRPGTEFTGEVAFHPGRGPRASVRTAPITAVPLNGPFGFESLSGALDVHSSYVALNPWNDRALMPLRDVIPIRMGDSWAVAGRDRDTLPLVISERAGWTLLALSGGKTIDLVAEYDGTSLSALAALLGSRFHTFANEERAAA